MNITKKEVIHYIEVDELEYKRKSSKEWFFKTLSQTYVPLESEKLEVFEEIFQEQVKYLKDLVTGI